MRTLTRLIALSALLVLSQKSHALQCKQDGANISGTYALPTTIAVANTLPKGTILWRSPNDTMTITCTQERSAGPEDVFFYALPGGNGKELGDDVEIGISINNTDYTYSNMDASDHGPRKSIDDFHLPGCPHGGCPGVTKTVTYNFFFVKKSEAGAEVKEGPVTGRWQVHLFQLDGAGGLNPNGGTYQMWVRNLDLIRYVACSSTIALSHPTINFGGLSNVNAQRDQIAGQKPFSITASKNCDSAYGLGALLKPLTDATLDAQREHVLVPEDNKSIGITLHDMDNNERVVPFNQEFELVPNSQDRTVTRHFAARAVWLTDKANTKLGKFNAGATIDIYYK